MFLVLIFTIFLVSILIVKYSDQFAYQNNYSNLLGNDLAATGGFGELDPFNAGRALVNGIEFLLKSE